MHRAKPEYAQLKTPERRRPSRGAQTAAKTPARTARPMEPGRKPAGQQGGQPRRSARVETVEQPVRSQLVGPRLGRNRGPQKVEWTVGVWKFEDAAGAELDEQPLVGAPEVGRPDCGVPDPEDDRHRGQSDERSPARAASSRSHTVPDAHRAPSGRVARAISDEPNGRVPTRSHKRSSARAAVSTPFTTGTTRNSMTCLSRLIRSR